MSIALRRGLGHLHVRQYHGKMSHEARSKSIKEFRDVPDKRILIASLKCGGVGLNLTMVCTLNQVQIHEVKLT